MVLFLLNSMLWLCCVCVANFTWQHKHEMSYILPINNIVIIISGYGALLLKFFDWSFKYWNDFFHLCFHKYPLTRIQPLSDALRDLYKKFNGLKDELGKLTTKFDSVEAFVDDLKDGRFTLPQRSRQRIPPSVGLRSPLRAQMRAPDSGIIARSTLIRARRRGPKKS